MAGHNKGMEAFTTRRHKPGGRHEAVDLCNPVHFGSLTSLPSTHNGSLLPAGWLGFRSCWDDTIIHFTYEIVTSEPACWHLSISTTKPMHDLRFPWRRLRRMMLSGMCSCKNRTYLLHHQGEKNRRTRNVTRSTLVSANLVPNSPILVTLMMEAILSSETSILTKAKRRNNPEDGFFN
jgi:hypothetical protein